MLPFPLSNECAASSALAVILCELAADTCGIVDVSNPTFDLDLKCRVDSPFAEEGDCRRMLTG